ncbi:MAG TPA: DUF2569 domain-containing protein [Spirochaetota bacterium]|nr:DUF2569 domain-containing protein [Spirochaetota bacterium]
MGEANIENNIVVAPQPEGLGGWLALVGLRIIVSPVIMVFQILKTYIPVFTNETWSILTTPGAQSYNPAWAPLIIIEIAVNVCMIALWVYIAYLYFTKKYKFKNWYIASLLIALLAPIIDSIATGILLPQISTMETKEIGQTIKQAIISGVWIAYILKSERVRNTFVK